MSIALERIYVGNATPGLRNFSEPISKDKDEYVNANTTIEIPLISLIRGLKSYSLLKEATLSSRDLEILKTIRTSFNVTADVGLRFSDYEKMYQLLTEQMTNFFDYINTAKVSLSVETLFKGWNYLLVYFGGEGNDLKFKLVGKNGFESLKDTASDYIYLKFNYNTDADKQNESTEISIDNGDFSLSSFVTPVEFYVERNLATGFVALYRINADVDMVEEATDFIRGYFKRIYNDKNPFVGQLLNRAFVTYDTIGDYTVYKVYGPNLFIPYNIELVYNAITTDYGIVSDDELRSVYGVFATDFVEGDDSSEEESNPEPIKEFKGFYIGSGKGIPVNIVTSDELHLKKLKNSSSEKG